MAKARILAVVIIGIMLLTAMMPQLAVAAPPGAPTGLSPANFTENISLTHIFRATYTGTTPNDQFASWWQIATENQTKVDGSFSDNVLVFNSGVDKANLTTLSMSRGYLSENTTYYWHVKQQDIYGNWSPWSAACQFTTVVSFPPHQPDNISPANGETEISPSHVFMSSAYYDPDGDGFSAMQAQITKVSGDYTHPLWDTGAVTGSTTWNYPAGLLEYDGTYYWHIRYQDDTGLWSDWSDETSFTAITNSPPSQPENFEPNNGATAVPLNPTLEASEFRDPNASELVLGEEDIHAASQWQVTATSDNYTSPVFDSDRVTADLTSINMPVGKLSANTTYYWHVAYQDSYGNWSDNSTQTSFTTGTTILESRPEKPVNVSPVDGATDISPDQKLRGSEFQSPVDLDHSYSWWQVAATSDNYTSPAFDSGIDPNSKTEVALPKGLLAYGSTYYWHVKYQDSTGVWSYWSDETSFTTGTTTVAVGVQQPVNVSPFGGATDISPDQKLKASASQGAAGRTHFASRWQVTSSAGAYSSSLFDSRIDPLNKLEIAMPVGLPDYQKTCYWHVKYQDDTGAWSAWSEETSFTVVANLPPCSPRNLEPLDEKTDVVVIPVLKASAFSDPDTSAYVALTDSHAASQWQVAASDSHDKNADGSYKNAVWDSAIASPTTSAIVPAGELAGGTKYFWHVRYQDSHENWSAYSEETWFTTKSLSLPVAGFSADKTEVVAGDQAVEFTDTSTPAGEIANWYWNFGDGTTDNWTLRNRPATGTISHIYTEAASDGNPYTVSLTVTNGNDPPDSDHEEKAAFITVIARPKAVIAPLTPKTAKAGEDIIVGETSTGDITQWVWDFGDGSDLVQWDKDARTAAVGKIKHTFKEAGTYVVTLKVVGTIEGQDVQNSTNWQIGVSGSKGFGFELWMVGVAVAAVVVVAGIMYLVRARKGK